MSFIYNDYISENDKLLLNSRMPYLEVEKTKDHDIRSIPMFKQSRSSLFL